MSRQTQLESYVQLLARPGHEHGQALLAAAQELVAQLKGVPHPGELLAEAYAIFHLEMNASHYEEWMIPDVESFARALGAFRDAVDKMSPPGLLYLAERAREHDIDFKELLGQLDVLAGIVSRVESPRIQVRSKEHNTKAALAAAAHLMEHGIKRQRAAKIVAGITQHFPDAERKSWQTIQGDMIRAGITSKPKKVSKVGGKGYPSLTPG
jgi:hypothetical protein